MYEALATLMESGMVTLVSVLFISTWAYRCGRASRQAEIEDLQDFLAYYREITQNNLGE